jgi:EmrB/QacA subfamily drug resistance transporter
MILIAMCVALVAVVASVSGLNVAQQQLAEDLGASQSTLLWIINGYTLAMAALLLPIGAVGDRWGRKPVLLIGLGIFGATNLMAAFAGSATVLLAARIGSGAAAAMIMPVTLSVITSSFPEEEKAKGVGVWAGFAGAGGIIGLFGSSFVIDYLSWPWVFALPILLSVVAFGFTLGYVGNSREDHNGRFDVVGSILSALAIGGIVLGIHEGPEKGWSDPLTVAGIVIGVVALIGFVMWELRHENPVFDVRLLGNRALAAGALTIFTLFAVMFGIFLVLMQFLQAVLAFSALTAAAGLLPMAVVMMVLSSSSPRIAARVGTRPLLISGLALFIVGLVVLALTSSVDGGYLSVLPGLLIVGVGLGLAMTPSTMAITESMPLEKQGVASALNDTVREVGGAVGVALLGSVLNSGYRSSVADAVVGLPAEAAGAVEGGIGQALYVAQQMGPQGESIAASARTAFVDGWHGSMWIAAGIAGLTLVYLLVTRPPRDADDAMPVLSVGERLDGQRPAAALAEVD